MSFDVFNQEVSTLDVDMNSMDQIEEPPFELEPESPAKKWAWRYGEDCECPSEGNFFAYDLESVPDTPRPEEVIIEPRMFDISNVLKSEATCKKFFSTPCNCDDAETLLIAERDGKKRKGVLNILEKMAVAGGEEIVNWMNRSKNPATCRIVSMGIQHLNEDQPQVWLAQNEKEERELIAAFFDIHMTGKIRVGYNIASYDDMLIFWRAIKLNVRVPKKLHVGRWGGKQSIDLMLKMFPGGLSDAIQLKLLLPSLGIFPPAGEINGSHVLAMVEGGQWEDLAFYVASDAWSEMELFKRVMAVLEL